MILLLADHEAYLFSGDMTTLGYYMVRISNFLCFFMTLFIIFVFNLYLQDLFFSDENQEAVPKHFRVSSFLCLIAMALVIISQFTGLYYTINEANIYQRSPGFVIS